MKVVRVALIGLFVVFSICAKAACAGLVNINVAAAETLGKVMFGIGPAKSQAIVRYRAEHGPFAAADDLSEVKGIGKKTIEKNRALVSVDDNDAARAFAAP